MRNQQLAKMFYEIADFLEMEDVAFKPAAYRKAAQILQSLQRDVEHIYEHGGQQAVEDIKGIGKSIASKIIEYLRTGRIKYYQQYKKKYPVDVEGLTAIEGVGSKTVRDLYKHLKVKGLDDLEKAAKQGKVKDLPGFGQKTEQNILEGIGFIRKSEGRFLLGRILPYVREIEEKIKQVQGVKRINVCGSVRRFKETIGDIDFLVAAEKPEKVMDIVCSLDDVAKVWGRGPIKSSVRLRQGFDVDVRLIHQKCYGAALQYFTGDKAHNVHLRKIAQDQGFKLNEYGLFKGKKQVAGKTEKEIYKALDMAFPPSEIRRDKGEIEAALHHKLPCLVKLSDIKGDLHCHSNWNGGKHTIKEMAKKAQNLGYKYIGISDHTKFLKIEHGLDEARLAEQRKEIEKLNNRFKDSRFKILQGAETNILKDGSIDIDNEALAKLDYAIAGIHSQMKMSGKQMTERIIKAMKNPHIKVISHPTGRLLKKRDPYQVDMGRLFRAARQYGTALEINSSPMRLDLKDDHIREAIDRDIQLIVNTDAHHKDQMNFMEYGVAQARRGWAEKKYILNTRPLKQLLKFF